MQPAVLPRLAENDEVVMGGHSFFAVQLCLPGLTLLVLQKKARLLQIHIDF